MVVFLSLYYQILQQVLPQFASKDWQPGQPVSEDDMTAWAEWENNFFSLEAHMDYQERVKATPKGKAKPKRLVRCPLNVKIIRGAAQQEMIAFDKLLFLMLGTGLVHFMVGVDAGAKDFGARRNPLRDQDFDDKPAPLPPTVCLHCDEGSPGFAMLWYLLYNKKLRFRFAPTRDIFHREWNDVRCALGDSKVWYAVLLTTMVINVPHGPWESSAWWVKMTSAAVAYCIRSSWTSPLYAALYESIS